LDERLNTSRREDVHVFSLATNNRYYTENKWILKDLFDKSLKAKHGDYSLFDIQFEVLSSLIAVSSAFQQYLRWAGLLNRAVKTLKHNKAPLERVKQAHERLQFMKNSATAASFLIGQLRSIGDGIAWWFLNYDRATLRLLAEHEYVPVPELSRGLYAEIYECTKLASQGEPFLLNSITNFLRVGDITVRNRLTKCFELMEIKAGKSQTPRTIRQSKNLSLVQSALEGAEYSLLSDGVITNVTRAESKKPLLTHVKSLEHAMSEAMQKSASSRVFGEYLSIAVYYLRNVIKLPASQSKQISQNTIDRCTSIGKRNDIILHFSGSVSHQVHFSRMLAPYTIFPINNDLRFALMTGDFLITSFINVSGLVRWLRKRGWVIDILSLPDKAPDFSKSPFLPIFRVHKPNTPLAIEIPLSIIGAAAMELWMPESIEMTIQATISQGYSKNILVVNFPNTGTYAWD
jgi:hypothetical protein